MEYKIMEIPFENLKFREFTKKQAEEYFQWYMGVKDERIETLKRYIEREGDGNKTVNLDYTPESLISLWRWYGDHIILVDKKEEEIEIEKAKHPKWMHEYISSTKISGGTRQLCFDIGAYFAEVIIKNSDGRAYWGYLMKPKNMTSVKMPVVLGFMGGDFLEPNRVVYIATLKECDERNENRLVDLYYRRIKALDEILFKPNI